MHISNGIASLAGVSLSLAETFPYPACTSTLSSLIANAPTADPALAPWLPLTPTGYAPIALEDPEFYVKNICGVVTTLPPSLLPQFQTWASEAVSYGRDRISVYDAFITACLPETGAARSSLTSYIHSILTDADGICQTTATTSDFGGVWGSPVTTTAASTASSGSFGGVWGSPISTTAPTAATGINSSPSNTVTSSAAAAALRAPDALIGVAAMGGLLGVAVIL
ncbi:hypothetical protein F5Y14DRAFT_423297 [Nemania sp. NC0429]|nr:hypothetical protein F5Y14DRAFT_423297 [Nemania sp. NC0429]